MTAKIVAGVLLAGAFGYALWLHVFRKPLPDVTGRRGWRRRFFWATALFAAWFGIHASGCGGGSNSDLDVRSRSGLDESKMMCYAMAWPPTSSTVAEAGLSAAVRAAWLSLDGNRGEELRRALEKEVAKRGLSPDAAKLLRIAFRHTAYHYYRDRGEGARGTCYWGGSSIEGEGWTSEQLLTRMEFLADAARNGQIDQETHDKVAAEIAQSLAAFGAIDALPRNNSEKWRQTFEAIQAQTVPVTAAATEAAAALADIAATAPEGWAEAVYDAGGRKKIERVSDPSKPGVWQPPPPLSRKHGGFD